MVTPRAVRRRLCVDGKAGGAYGTPGPGACAAVDEDAVALMTGAVTVAEVSVTPVGGVVRRIGLAPVVTAAEGGAGCASAAPATGSTTGWLTVGGDCAA